MGASLGAHGCSNDVWSQPAGQEWLLLSRPSRLSSRLVRSLSDSSTLVRRGPKRARQQGGELTCASAKAEPKVGVRCCRWLFCKETTAQVKPSTAWRSRRPARADSRGSACGESRPGAKAGLVPARSCRSDRMHGLWLRPVGQDVVGCLALTALVCPRWAGPARDRGHRHRVSRGATAARGARAGSCRLPLTLPGLGLPLAPLPRRLPMG